MKKLLILLALTAAAPAYANTCIDTRQIDSSKSRDGHTWFSR